MTKAVSRTSRTLSPANDNDPLGGGKRITCDLPHELGILSGEAELIASYMSDLLLAIANDNEGG